MTRLLEEARAFEIIAPHLDDDTRKKVAERIARCMLPAEAGPARSAETLPGFDGRLEYEAADADPIVRFLRSLGYEDGELTRAAGRLASAVRADGAVAPITERYLALVWNRITEEAKPDAV